MTPILAFLGGIITFLSPCVLPMVPIYLAYISGISFSELENKIDKKTWLNVLFNSVLFVIGFTLVFVLLAALFYIFTSTLGSYKVWIGRVAGIFIILMGLKFIRIFKFNLFNNEIKIKQSIEKKSYFSSALMGMAFAAGWTPCVGPILSGILFTSSSLSNPSASILLLIIYSLGLGIPFVLTGIITTRLLKIFRWIQKHYRVVEMISGIFLIILGVLLITNSFGQLSSIIAGWLPGLNSLEFKLFH